MSGEKIGENTPEQLAPLQLSRLAVVPELYESSQRIEFGEEFLVGIDGGSVPPLSRPTPEQREQRKQWLRISEAVGLMSGKFLNWRTEGAFKGVIKDLDMVRQRLAELKHPEEDIIALNGIVANVKRRREELFAEKCVDLNRGVEDVSERNELWVKVLVPGRKVPSRVARLKGFYVDHDAEGTPLPGVILEDLAGTLGTLPPGTKTFGLYIGKHVGERVEA